MRPVYLTELNIAARVLMALPSDARADVMGEIVRHARIADKFRKHVGKRHPDWGNGSLSAACESHAKAPMPARCGQRYRQCLAVVLAALGDHGH